MLKRVIVATSVGIILGVFCWIGGVFLGLITDPPAIQIANIIAHRAAMGFVIAISAWRMNWAAHGVIMGSIIGVLFILFDAFAGMGTFVLFGLLIPGNAIYGLIIEYVTTKLFKAPQV